jgi:hypothetical protein
MAQPETHLERLALLAVLLTERFGAPPVAERFLPPDEKRRISGKVGMGSARTTGRIPLEGEHTGP